MLVDLIANVHINISKTYRINLGHFASVIFSRKDRQQEGNLSFYNGG